MPELLSHARKTERSGSTPLTGLEEGRCDEGLVTGVCVRDHVCMWDFGYVCVSVCEYVLVRAFMSV